MNITVYSEDIDRQLWDNVLSNNSVDIHNIYQTYEWAILMKKCYGLSPFFIVARNDECVCGGQLYFKKPVIKYLFAYESQGGPIIDFTQRASLDQLIIKYFNDLRGNSLFISLRPIPNPNSQTIFKMHGFIPTKFYTFLLDISISEEVIWESLKKNARNGIRKAQKFGIKIEEANTWNLWLDFYKLHVLHSKEKKIAPKSIDFFYLLYDLFLPKGMVKLFISYKDNVLYGGMLFLNFSTVMTYYIGASNDIQKDLSSNDLIMWTAIKWGRENGYSTLDLGDTWPNTGSHLYSIHKFKEKWGGRLIERNFFIKGSIYRLGRTLVLNNKYIQNSYEFLHEHRLI